MKDEPGSDTCGCFRDAGRCSAHVSEHARQKRAWYGQDNGTARCLRAGVIQVEGEWLCQQHARTGRWVKIYCSGRHVKAYERGSEWTCSGCGQQVQVVW